MKRLFLSIGLFCGVLLLCGLLFCTNISSEREELKALLDEYPEEFSIILSTCEDMQKLQLNRQWWKLSRKNIMEDVYPFYFDMNDKRIEFFPNGNVDFDQISPLIEACKTIFCAYPFDVLYVFYDNNGKLFVDFQQTNQEGHRYRSWYLSYMETGYTPAPMNWTANVLQLSPENLEVAPKWYIMGRLRDELD